MPAQLSQSDRKILWIAAAAFAVLVVFAVLLATPESDQSAIPSTYSAHSSGAKAAFLMLQETGWHVERWERSLTQLKGGKNRIMIIAEPEKQPNAHERFALQEFIRGGGSLIAIGQGAGLMLPERSDITGFIGEKVWEKFSALTPTSITREAPQITMVSDVWWASEVSALALYGNGPRIVVVTYPYGEGKVIWWAAATPLTNAGLREPGNLEFFLACLGDISRNQIYWDEYFHGYSSSRENSFENRFAAVLLVQFAILGAAILLTFSRRSGPVRPSAPESRLSPLEFVETLGGLYERAHAAAVAIDIHYQRFLYWLAKRLGMSPSASIEEFEHAVAARWNFRDEQFVPTLKECASARYRDLSARRALQLVRLLHSYAVQLSLYSSSAKENERWKPSGNY
jgi:hypothetical protein